MTVPLWKASLASEYRWFFAQSRAPHLRNMREFAEQELVIPEGKYKDQLWSADVQPYTTLLLNEYGNPRWRHFRVTGCVQSGKSLHAYVLPILWHLFEYRETTGCGIPTMDVSKDKWREEILPAIKANPKFSVLLPERGPGSRGGTGNLESVKFKHGPTLKFLSAGGGDEKRSSFTTRVMVMTEIDKMDEAGEQSRETDPVSQMLARLDSYDESERVDYGECTVSIKSGRIWRDMKMGSDSRMACPCPHCHEYVTPEKEHIKGWEHAETKEEAAAAAFFVCPACGEKIDDRQREAMNRAAKLVHAGQTVAKDGTVHGADPKSNTFSFRWNAFNNLFWTIATIGAKAWTVANAEFIELDPEAEKKDWLQFRWAEPYEAPQLDLTPIDVQVVKRRQGVENEGILPPDTKAYCLGLDIGKWVCWWGGVAFRDGPRMQIVQYGNFEVPSHKMSPDKAILFALREFRDEVVLKGWAGANGMRLPEQVWIDPGYYPDTVYAFCRESGERFRACEGCGVGQHYRRQYTKPTQTGNIIRYMGDNYHVVWRPRAGLFVIEANADYWKSKLHEGLAIPMPESGEPPPGSIVLHHTIEVNGHLSIVKQFASEGMEEQIVPGLGPVKKWVHKNRKRNHLLDAVYRALAAGHLCGIRFIVDEQSRPRSSPRPEYPAEGVIRTENRPFLLTERT